MADECQDVLSKGADCLHVDVMDGHFVPNLTMGQDMCRALRSHLPDTYLDVHLMVEHPDRFIDMFADAGADMFNFHLEVSRPIRESGVDINQMITRIKDRGMDAGVTINPPTDPYALEPYLSDLDLVLVMSVNPGRSGQRFMDEVLSKTRWLRERIGPNTRLEMDGGVNPSTAPIAVEAGADMLVTASALFGSDDRAAIIRQLHDAGAAS